MLWDETDIFLCVVNLKKSDEKQKQEGKQRTKDDGKII